MADVPSFGFLTCQVGAEPALKQEVAREWPGLRFAFSRPGFLTFKIAPGKKIPDNFGEKLVFARAWGFCLGKVTSATAENRADLVWKMIGDLPPRQIHVWPRDRYSPGYRDYEPGMTAEAAATERVIRELAPAKFAQQIADSNFQFSIFNLKLSARAPQAAGSPFTQRDPPSPPLLRGGVLVADVVIVDDVEWWVGYHRVHS